MNKAKIIVFLIIISIVAIAFYLYSQYKKLYNATWSYAGTKIKKLGFDKVSFVVSFNINNTGDLGIIVSEQMYDVYLNGTFLSHIKNKQDVPITANSVSSMPLLVEINNKDLINAGMHNLTSLIAGDKSNIVFNVKGYFTLKLGPIVYHKIPFDENWTLADMM